MQNEKSGNTWKQNIEDVSSFPGAALPNKEAMWEKLQVRLAKKPNRKGFALYWIAAASFLIIASVTLVINHKQTASIRYSSVIKNDKKSVPVRKENAVITRHTTAFQTQLKKTASHLPVTIAVEEKTKFIDSPGISITIKNMQQLSQANLNSTAISDTNSMAFLPLKNLSKLKIVHANELGDAIEIPADVVHHTDLHIFQLKLAQQEIYNASSTAANNYSGISFKSKKTSN